MMSVQRRAFLAGGTAALPFAAVAQDRRKIVVGLLSWWPAFMQGDYVPRLRTALGRYGYVEGQNLELLVAFTGGDPARTREAAKRFVGRGVDVIVAMSTPAVTIVKEETQARQIPVVMAPVSDPIATGLVQSIARPGGNLTGMSMAGPDISGKRLQILRDIIPDLKSIAFVGWTRDQNNKTFAASLERVAAPAGVAVTIRMVDSVAQIDAALMTDFKQAGAQALVIQPIFIGQHVGIIETARKSGLPSVSDFPAFADAGALFTYGFDDRARMERAAYFVDRIVKGTKPADLPIELPSDFALVLNRKTATAFGLTVPPSVLAQAAEIIE